MRRSPNCIAQDSARMRATSSLRQNRYLFAVAICETSEGTSPSLDPSRERKRCPRGGRTGPCMTTSHDLPTVASNPSASLDFLGPAPLIRTEDAADYDTLLAGIIGAVRPADILEEIWVRDVVVLVWEAERLRRLKAALMNACAHRGLDKVLLRFDGIDALGLSKRWGAGDA